MEENCIDEQIIKKMIDDNKIYLADNGNIGFNTESDEYGFAVEGRGEDLKIFENPIEILSYMSLNKDNESHLLALDNKPEESIDVYVSKHPEIKRIGLALYNNSERFFASVRIAAKYRRKGYECYRDEVRNDLLNTGCIGINEYLIRKNNKLIDDSQPEQEKNKHYTTTK
jgi:hypothetical protein